MGPRSMCLLTEGASEIQFLLKNKQAHLLLKRKCCPGVWHRDAQCQRLAPTAEAGRRSRVLHRLGFCVANLAHPTGLQGAPRGGKQESLKEDSVGVCR